MHSRYVIDPASPNEEAPLSLALMNPKLTKTFENWLVGSAYVGREAKLRKKKEEQLLTLPSQEANQKSSIQKQLRLQQQQQEESEVQQVHQYVSKFSIRGKPSSSCSTSSSSSSDSSTMTKKPSSPSRLPSLSSSPKSSNQNALHNDLNSPSQQQNLDSRLSSLRGQLKSTLKESFAVLPYQFPPLFTPYDRTPTMVRNWASQRTTDGVGPSIKRTFSTNLNPTAAASIRQQQASPKSKKDRVTCGPLGASSRNKSKNRPRMLGIVGFMPTGSLTTPYRVFTNYRLAMDLVEANSGAKPVTASSLEGTSKNANSAITTDDKEFNSMIHGSSRSPSVESVKSPPHNINGTKNSDHILGRAQGMFKLVLPLSKSVSSSSSSSSNSANTSNAHSNVIENQQRDDSSFGLENFTCTTVVSAGPIASNPSSSRSGGGGGNSSSRAGSLKKNNKNNNNLNSSNTPAAVADAKEGEEGREEGSSTAAAGNNVEETANADETKKEEDSAVDGVVVDDKIEVKKNDEDHHDISIVAAPVVICVGSADDDVVDVNDGIGGVGDANKNNSNNISTNVLSFSNDNILTVTGPTIIFGSNESEEN